MREDDYKLSMEKLYQQNRLLISALHEIYGEEIQSTSLFCLEHDISFLTRNKSVKQKSIKTYKKRQT